MRKYKNGDRAVFRYHGQIQDLCDHDRQNCTVIEDWHGLGSENDTMYKVCFDDGWEDIVYEHELRVVKEEGCTASETA